ncbi:cobalt-precorrin-6A reductase [Nakamurella sp. YIM 132084]|uniref:Cobalt-precorrin-6A reductase n=1 Tax=Nakamurella leprariae TaxID=2803911 RepID=A0A938YCH6_9ACTN|nr:cobalt-precorrin-6A reductase [Nakamurella leprariae]
MGSVGVLILGGTGEARALARSLVDAGITVTSSLAGRVADPALPVGEVRIGGFGGPAGLARYLNEHGIGAVVDATHPFARNISASAVAATDETGVPLIRLERPGWADHPLASTWHWDDSNDAAAARLTELTSGPVFLTTGRSSVTDFAVLAGRPVLVRLVDPPGTPLPGAWQLLLARGPYTVKGERDLMAQHRIAALATKDSGGSMTEAKLLAADSLGVPIVVIRRPAPAVGHDGPADTVRTVADAAAWVSRHVPR